MLLYGIAHIFITRTKNKKNLYFFFLLHYSRDRHYSIIEITNTIVNLFLTHKKKRTNQVNSVDRVTKTYKFGEKKKFVVQKSKNEFNQIN